MLRRQGFQFFFRIAGQVYTHRFQTALG